MIPILEAVGAVTIVAAALVLVWVGYVTWGLW